MASPLSTGKQSVNLAPGEVRVSKIRRDPPPPLIKEISIRERNERDIRMAVIGVVAFALALFVITLAFASWSGWSPRDYTIHIED
jgi:hypothetical protein